MVHKRSFTLVLAAGALLLLLVAAPLAQALEPIEELGKAIFNDTNLSAPPGQSCATCHAPDAGFTGPDSEINDATAVYPGAVPVRFGNRKPPTAAYGGDSPVLYFDEDEGVWIGGMFWDGRATGWTLGDPLAEQAQGPFLNPLEQNMPGAKQVVGAIARSAYAGLFEEVWGTGSLSTRPSAIAAAYEKAARSVAAYERSSEVNPFSSKYDAYLAEEAELTDQEALGLALFENEEEGGGKCSLCHLSRPGPNGEPPLFTDFTYDNLGVPKNLANPFYSMPPFFNPDGAAWVDAGLGGFLKAAYPEADYLAEWGKVKVPTLRNVDLRPNPEFAKVYGHNGFFKSLEEIVHFYNTRDTENWPAPEVPVNVNTDELGNLGLTADEEAAIVAFMKTLSDGFVP